MAENVWKGTGWGQGRIFPPGTLVPSSSRAGLLAGHSAALSPESRAQGEVGEVSLTACLLGFWFLEPRLPGPLPISPVSREHLTLAAPEPWDQAVALAL